MKVFVIIFDTLKKDHTGKTYGNSWIKTPNFDEFANDCLVFEKAYPESLPTIPVRRAIHTGIRTFPFNKDVEFRTDDFVEAPGWSPIPDNQTHISEYLNKYGYLTSFITSTYHQYKPCMNFHLGFDEWHAVRGHEYDKYIPTWRGSKSSLRKRIKQHIPERTEENYYEVQLQKLLLKKYFKNTQDWKSEEDYMPAKTFKKAAESIETSKGVKNHFCLIDEFDPHEPWDPPLKYYNLYKDMNYSGGKIIQPIYGENTDLISKEELKCMRACYAGEVSLCDTWFGYFIENLKEMDLYDESLIFFISDHGHSMGEHSAVGKIPQFMFPELVDLPFMIKPPGNVNKNGPIKINSSYVYDIDILPTIFGFLEKDTPKQLDGRDLSVFINNPDYILEGRDYITCGMALWTLYKDDSYAFITGNDKTEQKLFDLSKDPNWNENIARENNDICDRLYQKIESDSGGNLLKEFHSDRFEDFDDWYHNTYEQ
jgi:arylsulfatase A-like enzyme